jgi:hypothetical protein
MEGKMKICQSCGMPMSTETLYGKNTDGSMNEDYCTYCYPEGSFNNPSETLQEMIESCIPFMMKEGYSESDARDYLVKNLTGLKRWS